MVRHIINGPVNEDMLSTLITILNSYTVDEEIHIYLSSEGGNIAIAETMKTILEEDGRITLIAFDTIGSAALYLFLTTKCKKRLTKDTIGCFHFPYVPNVTMNHKLEAVVTSDLRLFKRLPDIAKKAFKIIKPYLSKRELKAVKNGDDKWFTYKDLKKIMKKIS